MKRDNYKDVIFPIYRYLEEFIYIPRYSLRVNVGSLNVTIGEDLICVELFTDSSDGNTYEDSTYYIRIKNYGERYIFNEFGYKPNTLILKWEHPLNIFYNICRNETQKLEDVICEIIGRKLVYENRYNLK
jgi:hypothetical protein